MSEVKNILFDLGNVIIDIDIPLAIENLAYLMKKPDNFDPVLKAILAYETGAIATELFINRIIRDARPSVQAIDVIEAWNSMLIGIPPHRLVMLDELKPHYSLFVLSNTNPLHLEWIHTHLKEIHQIDDFEGKYFQKVFYSHLVKDRKPNASIYETVLKEANLKATETLFLDDMEDNIESASALGFKTHLVEQEIDVGVALSSLGILKE